MPSLRTALFVLLFSLPVHAQWQSIGNIDAVLTDRPGELTLRSGRALVQIRLLEQDIVQVRCAPSGTFAPGASRAVLRAPGLAAGVRMRKDARSLSMATARVQVVVGRRPLRISVLDSAGAVITQDDPARGMAWSGDEVRVWKTRPQGERYYGFGEKAGSLERTETAMTMWNTDIPGYAADTDPLYETIPFFYGIRAAAPGAGHTPSSSTTVSARRSTWGRRRATPTHSARKPAI